MKKTRLILSLLVAVFMTMTALFAVSCVKIVNDEPLEMIEAVNIPEYIFIGEFDNAGIKLRVTVGDDVQEIPVTESMLPESYRALLTEEGTYDITVLYRGKEVTFTVRIRNLGYFVRFINFDGEVVKTCLVSVEDGVTGLKQPTEKQMFVEGYRFLGYFDKEIGVITEDIDFVGQYIKTWHVRFYNGAEELIDDQIVDYGASATSPSEDKYAMEGYDFVGWDNEFTNITADAKICGIYSKITYPVPETYYYVDDSHIMFGSYPQTDVTASKGKELSSQYVDLLPENGNNNGWTGYGYYVYSALNADFMWYKDVDIDENGDYDYRAVYFTSYRPDNTTNNSTEDHSYQDDNGYYASNVYWFKFEPIKWRILETDGTFATMISEIAIDSGDFNYTQASAQVGGNYVSASDYERSSIRAWLNDTFYNTAFNALQKAMIETVEVDNSARSANPDNDATAYNNGVNNNACANTFDNVWLLSEREVTKAGYGFDIAPGNADEARQISSSDYAKAQGCKQVTGDSYDGCTWWLRSPVYYYSGVAFYVKGDGKADGDFSLCATYIGIVPAVKIAL